MFFSSSKNLMLVNERVLIIYPSDLFSVEFSSGISTIENLPDVIISCCVLHNIYKMKGDCYIDNDDVLEHTLQRERERTQRREEREFHASANTLRDILTDYVNADN